MTDQEKRDMAVEKAGKILIEAFDGLFGTIKFNLQGRRKSVHANIAHLVEVEIVESKQFTE